MKRPDTGNQFPRGWPITTRLHIRVLAKTPRGCSHTEPRDHLPVGDRQVQRPNTGCCSCRERVAEKGI